VHVFIYPPCLADRLCQHCLGSMSLTAVLIAYLNAPVHVKHVHLPWLSLQWAAIASITLHLGALLGSIIAACTWVQCVQHDRPCYSLYPDILRLPSCTELYLPISGILCGQQQPSVVTHALASASSECLQLWCRTVADVLGPLGQAQALVAS
jgi:hypothetical protein